MCDSVWSNTTLKSRIECRRTHCADLHEVLFQQTVHPRLGDFCGPDFIGNITAFDQDHLQLHTHTQMRETKRTFVDWVIRSLPFIRFRARKTKKPLITLGHIWSWVKREKLTAIICSVFSLFKMVYYLIACFYSWRELACLSHSVLKLEAQNVLRVWYRSWGACISIYLVQKRNGLSYFTCFSIIIIVVIVIRFFCILL